MKLLGDSDQSDFLATRGALYGIGKSCKESSTSVFILISAQLRGSFVFVK